MDKIRFLIPEPLYLIRATIEPGSTKFISLPKPGPFSVSHKLPVMGSKLPNMNEIT